jgi:hypothetical protein
MIIFIISIIGIVCVVFIINNLNVRKKNEKIIKDLGSEVPVIRGIKCSSYINGLRKAYPNRGECDIYLGKDFVLFHSKVVPFLSIPIFQLINPHSPLERGKKTRAFKPKRVLLPYNDIEVEFEDDIVTKTSVFFTLKNIDPQNREVIYNKIKEWC